MNNPQTAKEDADPQDSLAMTLTVTDGPCKGRTFSLVGHDVFLVGRSVKNHLQIKDDYFSRTHFMIEANPPLYRLKDMGSLNKTFVNGQQVEQMDLHDGDKIKAGHTILEVCIPAMPPPEPALAETGISTEGPTLRYAVATPPAEPVEKATLPLEATPAVPNVPSLALAPTLTGPPKPSPVPLATPSLSGTGVPQIKGYKIVRELGRGGMGVVYEAIREADNSRVAVKTIIPAAASQRRDVERFKREANILCQLDHANIIRFREVGDTEGLLYFAMDFVEGCDGHKLLKERGPLPIKLAARIIWQLLSGLAYAHDKGFVHRDIKPQNLLISEEGGKKVVKVADFGLARVYQESRLSGLSLSGEASGTPLYMPPEQITAFRFVKPAADQYSAAVTLYTLLTDCVVFNATGASMPALLQMILHKEPVSIRERRPEVPEELAAVIHRAMAKEIKDRYPDVRAFRQALTPFAQ